MNERTLCCSCRFKKSRESLPCDHPVALEELAKCSSFTPGYELARANGNIRKRLDLKFRSASWDVIGCKGYAKVVSR